MSDDDRQAAPPPNLHLQNAEAAFGIVEGHALDRAGQGFRRRTLIARGRSDHVFMMSAETKPALPLNAYPVADPRRMMSRTRSYNVRILF